MLCAIVGFIIQQPAYVSFRVLNLADLGRRLAKDNSGMRRRKPSGRRRNSTRS